jgi:hypothetical protein
MDGVDHHITGPHPLRKLLCLRSMENHRQYKQTVSMSLHEAVPEAGSHPEVVGGALHLTLTEVGVYLLEGSEEEDGVLRLLWHRKWR